MVIRYFERFNSAATPDLFHLKAISTRPIETFFSLLKRPWEPMPTVLCYLQLRASVCVEAIKKRFCPHFWYTTGDDSKKCYSSEIQLWLPIEINFKTKKHSCVETLTKLESAALHQSLSLFAAAERTISIRALSKRKPGGDWRYIRSYFPMSRYQEVVNEPLTGQPSTETASGEAQLSLSSQKGISLRDTTILYYKNTLVATKTGDPASSPRFYIAQLLDDVFVQTYVDKRYSFVQREIAVCWFESSNGWEFYNDSCNSATADGIVRVISPHDILLHLVDVEPANNSYFSISAEQVDAIDEALETRRLISAPSYSTTSSLGPARTTLARAAGKRLATQLSLNNDDDSDY